MKVLSINKRGLAGFAALVCMIAASSVLSMAANKSVVRDLNSPITFSGECCSSWTTSVKVIEPEKLAPIVVTWSADYRATTPFYSGVMVNGGPCTFDGPLFIPTATPEDGTYAQRTVQWVIMPGDYKLVPGPNVIKLCGGAVFPGGTLIVGFNTLTARLDQ
jgi:hypothetical protein